MSSSLAAWRLPEAFVLDLTRDLDATSLDALARLGEQFDMRERVAPSERHWPHDESDASALRAWRTALRPDGALTAGAAFAREWGSTVRACFRGVAAVLRLPAGVGDGIAEAAAGQLDLAVAMANRDMAARLVETAGEPIAALAEVLGEAGRALVEACVSRRPAWSAPIEILRRHTATATAATCADAVVFARVVDHLRRGTPARHPMGPPGWGVVAANRARLRGRLRAVVAGDSGALLRAIESLDGLHARTTVTVGRFAWDWAWREARSSFGFDPSRLRPPVCLVPAAPARPTYERPVLRTFLLHVAGSGAWADLEAWVGGTPGRALGRTFYRCLAALPDRRYDAVRSQLADGGLDALLPELRAIAARIAALPEDRNLRRRTAEVLAPVWTGIPLPGHHLPRFRRGMAELISAPRRPGPSPASG